MFRRIAPAFLMLSSLLLGQVERPDPPPVQRFAELRQNLGLTAAQVDELIRIMNEKNDALRQAAREIAEKQGELQTLLHSGSKDAYKIGQLMLDIHALSTQPPPSGTQYRDRALAVLTPDQRTKLGPLDQALRLQTPASQAIVLNLINPPVEIRPVPLPTLTPSDGTPAVSRYLR